MFSVLLFCIGIVFVKADSVCVRKYFSGPSGTISTPNYPYSYTNNLDCYSYIFVSYRQNIMIKFSAFATESKHDWVMFTCVSGNVFTSPRYSGSQIPASFTIFSCNFVNVSFHTDNSDTNTGFSFTYTSTSGCDNRYLSEPTGIILSPNFPRAYDHYLDCNSYISVLPGHTIAITFLAFSTTQNYDIVTITCSSGNAYASPRYSGHQIPAVSRISGCNLLKIHFRSEDFSTYTGFLLTYNITSGCSIGNFSGSTGQISSPNFPMAYNSYLDCSSYISVTSGKTIIISFLTFNFESLHGWVEISCASGKAFRPPLYSGSELPPVLTIANCNLVNVSFHTDGSVTNTGFILKYNIASDNGIRGFTTKPSNAFPRSDKTEAVIFNCTSTSEYFPWWTINDRTSRNYTITNSICEVITSSPYSSWFITETLGPGSCNLIVSAPADSLYLLAGSLVCTDSTLSSARAILAPINIELRLATDTKSMAAVTGILRDEDIRISCNSSFTRSNSDPSPVFTYSLYNGGPHAQMHILRTYWTSEGNVVSTIDTTDTSSAVLVKAPKDGLIPSYTCNIVCYFFTNISDLTANSEIELSFSTEPVDFEVLYKTYQNLKLRLLILGALLGAAILTTVILVAIILSRKCRQPKRNTAADAGHKCGGSEHELRQRGGEGNAYYAVDFGNAVEVAESENDDPNDMYENASENAVEVVELENDDPDDIYENASGQK